jgi:hypothetical protein
MGNFFTKIKIVFSSLSKYKVYLALVYSVIQELIGIIQYVRDTFDDAKIKEIAATSEKALIGVNAFILKLSKWLGVDIDDNAASVQGFGNIDDKLASLKDKVAELNSIK